MPTNIYKRGSLLWWRRSVHFSALEQFPIIVRISLRTRCPREARARAGRLETEMPVVEMQLRESLRIRVTPDDMRAVYKEAFTAALDRYIVQQATTPFHAEAHAAANLVYARYFTWLASNPEAPKADDASRQALIAKGLTPAEIDALHLTVGMHGGSTPIGPGRRHLSFTGPPT